jgi:tetratricopeptide (TPR) repeat protein
MLSAAVEGRLPRERGLEIAFRLHRYWAATNVAEGRYWLSRLLTDAPDEGWTAHATYALGYLSYWSGDAENAVPELQRAVELLADTQDSYAARALIFLAGLLDDLDRGAEAIEFVGRAIEAAKPFGIDLQVSAAMGMGCVLAERADPSAASYAADAIELCRNGGSSEQLAAALPTASMVCWQVGALEQARAYVAEAMPMHAADRRIARVVLLSTSAGIALADGDIAGAIELGRNADTEATELGVERETPLIRAVLAHALLRHGEIREAADRIVAAIATARSMSFGYPLAICLEAAAVIAFTAGITDRPPLARLLAYAAVIRERGDRPSPPTLAPTVDAVRAEFAADLADLADLANLANLAVGGPADDAVAAALAVTVLSSLI